jgi:ribosomal protein S18 acetylase RimI-like enzyme
MLCPFERRLMKTTSIRKAAPDDLPGVAALWHERITLQQQSDRRFTLAPDAPAQWTAAAAGWLADPDCLLLAAERDGVLVGYAMGRMQDAPPGLLPARIGAVTEMHVGVHSYQTGLGRALLDELRAWFAQQGAAAVVVQVPHRQPVEQAFWRALGATEWIDTMWMKL